MYIMGSSIPFYLDHMVDFEASFIYSYGADLKVAIWNILKDKRMKCFSACISEYSSKDFCVVVPFTKRKKDK
jgi:hypothetical protein